MSDKKITYFSIGQQKILINLDYKSIANNANSITLKSPKAVIADEAKKENKVFGYIFEKYHNSIKYVLLNNIELGLNDKNKKSFSIGSALIASIYKNSIFIKKLDKEANDDSIENKYWLCHIDNEGDILDLDTIVYSDEELVSLVKSRTDIFGSQVVAFPNEVEFLNIDNYIEVDLDLLKLQTSKPNFQVIKVFKNDALKNKIIIGAFSTLLLSLGFIQFIYENDYKNSLLNREFETIYSEQLGNFEIYKEKINSINKKSKEYYIEQGKLEFLDHYNKSFFSNTEILNNIYYLDSYMETYAQEWKISKIIFKDNDFFITYEKINDSIGVFKDLDKHIKYISDTNKDIEIKPFALINSGNTRVYSIDFGFNQNKENYFKNKQNKTLKEEKIELLQKNEEKIMEFNNRIADYEYQVTNLSKFNLFFTNDAKNLYNEIEIQSSALNELYSELNKTLSKEEKPVVIEDSKLSNDILDYVSITQMDNLFKWSYPANGNFFPKMDNSNKEQFYFSKSYFSEISSIEKMSTDVLSMTEALTYLEKPYIQIQEVEFQKGDGDKNEEKWAIRLEIYTKNQD